MNQPDSRQPSPIASASALPLPNDNAGVASEPRPRKTGRAAGHILSSLAVNLFRVPISFVVGILVARLLGPTQLGVYAFLTIFNTTLAPLVNLGLPIGINYYLSRKDYQLGEVMFSCILVGIVQGCLTALLVWSGWQLGWLGETIKLAPPDLVYAVLFLMPLTGLDMSLSGVLRGAGAFHVLNAIRALNAVMTPLLLLALVVFGGAGLRGLVAVQWIVAAVTAVVDLTVLLRRYRMRWSVRWDFLKASLRYGIAGWAGTAVFRLGIRLDQFILGIFLTAADLGRYSLAVGWSERLWILPDSVGPILFNRVASDKNRASAQRVTEQVHRLLIVLMAVLGFFMALLGWLLVPLLYGKDFTESASYLLLLLPGTLGMVSTKVLTKYTSGAGKPGYGSYAAVLGSLFGVAGYAALIPLMGTFGVALSTSLSYLSMGWMCSYFYRRMVRPAATRLWIFQPGDLNWLKEHARSLLRRIPVLGAKLSRQGT